MTVADNGGFDIAAVEVMVRDYVAKQRWFGSREKRLASLSVDDLAQLRDAAPEVWFLSVSVGYEDRTAERFSVPVGVVTQAQTEAALIGKLHGSDVVDAVLDPRCAAAIWEVIAKSAELPSRHGRVYGDGTTTPADPSELSALPADTTNTAVIRDQSEFLKWVRRLDPGPSIEAEMLDALRTGGFHHFPKPLGGLHYEAGDEPPTQLCFLSEYLAAPRAAWTDALGALASSRLFAQQAGELGTITAEMHNALVSDDLDSSMRARSMSRADAHTWLDGVEAELTELLSGDNESLAAVTENRNNLLALLRGARRLESYGLATRIHGDYHLGQVCQSKGRWWVLDFEGEPARSAAERRRHTSPLQDVAGMLRSFDYAGAVGEMEGSTDAAFASKWVADCRQAFWSAYVQAVQNREMLPSEPEARVLRRAFEIAKAIYEVRYELGHRPAWVRVPATYLAGVRP